MELEHIYPVNKESYRDREDFEHASSEEKEEIIEQKMDRANLEKQKSFHELAELNEGDQEKKDLYEKVCKISERIQEKGGIALVVGGFARDSVMKSIGYELDPKDIDIEVYGIELAVLNEILAEFGEVNTLGASFGVLKLDDLDISIPRSDSKVGDGHTGFEITGDPKMLLRKAVIRRDLTINALALNPLTGEVIDAVGGLDDIVHKKLRAVDPSTFIEDPLRVLRVMQFAGRFDFDVEEDTKELCVELVRDGKLDELPIERFKEEWTKLLLKSKKPSKGLEVARELEIVNHYPELKALIGCKQEYDWHPEGDVWTHTLMVLDEAKKICEREKLDSRQSLILLFSALCHDLGKPLTTKIQNIKGVDRITSYGHEEAGVEPSQKFLESISLSKEMIEEVLPLVEQHLFPTKYTEQVTDASLKRLTKKLAPASLSSLVMLGEADVHGRGYWKDQPQAIDSAKEWTGYTSGELLLAHAGRLPDISVTSSKTIKYMTGKTLINLGLSPKLGKKFGSVLNELERAQEEGLITGPDDVRLAKLFVFLEKRGQSEKITETLLTGEVLSTEEMIREVKDRFFEIGTHDMGTLVMTLLLKGEPLPSVLEKNKSTILTAHKHGPAWFKHFDKEFYETSWKSFYGAFEVNDSKQKELAKLDFEEQLKIGLDLITNPHQEWINQYTESFDVKPVEHTKTLAYYITDMYPFETGMMEGFKIMIQYIPEKKRLCVSIMNEDPKYVKEIDEKIREMLPEFKNAKKVGYLFASNENGEDDVFSKDDGMRVYKTLVDILN